MAVSVELTALCSPDARPGRFSEAAHCLNEQACASGVDHSCARAARL